MRPSSVTAALSVTADGRARAGSVKSAISASASASRTPTRPRCPPRAVARRRRRPVQRRIRAADRRRARCPPATTRRCTGRVRPWWLQGSSVHVERRAARALAGARASALDLGVRPAGSLVVADRDDHARRRATTAPTCGFGAVRPFCASPSARAISAVRRAADVATALGSASPSPRADGGRSCAISAMNSWMSCEAAIDAGEAHVGHRIEVAQRAP